MVYSIDPNSLGIQKGQFMSIKGKVLDIVSNFRSYCEGVDVNSSTCDIMQKELNEKYKSFKQISLGGLKEFQDLLVDSWLDLV
jgi:hypothetical protein